MAATAWACWLLASHSEKRRRAGFWMSLVSNVLWTIWGIHDKAWAVILLQVCLAVLNIRGVAKTNEQDAST